MPNCFYLCINKKGSGIFLFSFTDNGNVMVTLIVPMGLTKLTVAIHVQTMDLNVTTDYV